MDTKNPTLTCKDISVGETYWFVCTDEDVNNPNEYWLGMKVRDSSYKEYILDLTDGIAPANIFEDLDKMIPVEKCPTELVKR